MQEVAEHLGKSENWPTSGKFAACLYLWILEIKPILKVDIIMADVLLVLKFWK